MQADSIVVALLAIVSLGLLVTGLLGLDAVGVGLLVVLCITGIVDLQSVLEGFSNPALVTLACLYVIAEGLTRTGALEGIARTVLSISKGSELRALTTICLLTTVTSAFISDTAVVLVMIPICVGLAGDLNVPVSRFLMPVAFCALLGGTLTLVGSSINLLASAAAEQCGAQPIGMFEMTPAAVPLCIIGVAATILLSRRLIPDRASLTSTLARSAPREYVTEVVLGPASPLVGLRAKEAFDKESVGILFVVRDEHMIWPPLDDQILQAGDVVMLKGNVSQFVGLESRLGLRMIGDTRFDPRTMTFFELAVAPHSTIVGRRVGQLHLFREYGALVVAVLRHGQHIRERASQLVLRGGDLLLVCGDVNTQARLRHSTDFFMLTGAHEWVVMRGQARRALAVLAGVVALFVGSAIPILKPFLPVPVVALAGAFAIVATGCVTAQRAYRAIDWPVLIFVAGALALGNALQTTGLAAEIARTVVNASSPFGPHGLAAGLLLLGTVLNQFTSPYAVVVLLTPIALATAEAMGLANVRPLLLAIAFSGSNAFATPMGHQVNLMVMGPGGYRYADFLRIGLPLCFLAWIVVSAGLVVQSMLSTP